MVVSDDEAVGRNDEARTQRLRLARLGFLRLAALAEEPFERGSGEGIVGLLNLDPLAGGDVHHRRGQLFGQIRKAFRRARSGHDTGHLRLVVLGNLRPGGVAGDEGNAGTAKQEGSGQSIGITHGLHVLSILP